MHSPIESTMHSFFLEFTAFFNVCIFTLIFIGLFLTALSMFFWSFQKIQCEIK
jgi:hypothetical protein